MNTAELRGKRADTIKEARRVYEAAESEKRDPSAEEREQFDRLMASADVQLRDIERLERLERDEAGLAAIPETRAARREPETATATGMVPRAIKRTATPEYRQAFQDFLRFGSASPELRAGHATFEVRDLSVGTTTAGGYTVPDDFESSILAVLRDETPMRGVSTVQTRSNDTKFPLITTHATAAWQTENSTYTGGSDTVFDQLEIEALKAGTIIKVSEELLMDSATDVEALVRDEIVQSIGVLENTAYTVGNGTTQPQGITGRAAAGVTAASATALTTDELLDLQHSVKAGYRRRARFMCEDASLKVVRKLKTSDGQYIYQPGLTLGAPDVLLGNPLTTNEDMASIATGAISFLYGDFSRFYIVDRAGIFVQRLNERYADAGQVGFRVFHRTDSNLMLTEAVKKLTQA